MSDKRLVEKRREELSSLKYKLFLLKARLCANVDCTGEGNSTSSDVINPTNLLRKRKVSETGSCSKESEESELELRRLRESVKQKDYRISQLERQLDCFSNELVRTGQILPPQRAITSDTYLFSSERTISGNVGNALERSCTSIKGCSSHVDITPSISQTAPSSSNSICFKNIDKENNTGKQVISTETPSEVRIETDILNAGSDNTSSGTNKITLINRGLQLDLPDSTLFIKYGAASNSDTTSGAVRSTVFPATTDITDLTTTIPATSITTDFSTANPTTTSSAPATNITTDITITNPTTTTTIPAINITTDIATTIPDVIITTDPTTTSQIPPESLPVSKYKRIVDDNTGEIWFRCSVQGCGKKENNIDGIEYHVKNGHKRNKKRHMCDVCNRRFVSRGGLTHHRKQDHQLEDPDHVREVILEDPLQLNQLSNQPCPTVISYHNLAASDASQPSDVAPTAPSEIDYMFSSSTEGLSIDDAQPLPAPELHVLQDQLGSQMDEELDEADVCSYLMDAFHCLPATSPFGCSGENI